MTAHLPLSSLLWPLLLLLTLSIPFAAKPADDYFHDASAKYVESRMQQAVIEVEEGLRNYPGDPKLTALYDQLKKLADQQKKDNQKDQQKDQQGEEDKDKKPEDQDQDKDKQPPEDQKSPEDQEPEEEPKDSAAGAPDPKEVPEGEMSEEDAKRLLDAYKNDEKEDQKKMRNPPKKTVKQDW